MQCRNCGVTIEKVVMPGIGPSIIRTVWFDPSKAEDETDIYCDIRLLTTPKG